MNRLPRTLKSAMMLVGLDNQQLADEMNKRGFEMSANTISKILTGRRDVKFGEVEAFAAILGTPLEWLSQGPEWVRWPEDGTLPPRATRNPGLRRKRSNPRRPLPALTADAALPA